MRVLFADSAYYIALVNPRDRLHEVAVAIDATLAARSDVRFVTSDAVLVETLTRLSKYGPHLRRVAADFVQGLPDEPRVTIEPLTQELFAAALDLYRQRLDKNYSMTDCMSMVICLQRGITEVLSADHDFEQEGLSILLKRP